MTEYRSTWWINVMDHWPIIGACLFAAVVIWWKA